MLESTASCTLAPFATGFASGQSYSIDISVESAPNKNMDARLGGDFIVSYFPDGDYKLTLKDQRLVRGRDVTLNCLLATRSDLLKTFLALGTLKDAGAASISLVLARPQVSAPGGFDRDRLSAMLSSESFFAALLSLFADSGADRCFLRGPDGLERLPYRRLSKSRQPVSDRGKVCDGRMLMFFDNDDDFAMPIRESMNGDVAAFRIDSIENVLDFTGPLPEEILIAARPQKPEDVINLMLLSRALTSRGCLVNIYLGAMAMVRQHKSWTPKFHTYVDPDLELDSPEEALESASVRFILENIGCRWLIGHNLHFIKAGMVEVYNIRPDSVVPGIIDINAFPDLLSETVASVRAENPGRKIFVIGADKGVAADMADVSAGLKQLGVAAVAYLNKQRISSTQVVYDGNIYGVDGSYISPEELKDAVVILADDEIASGGTIVGAAKLLDRLAEGRAGVYLSTVLGKFSGDCWQKIKAAGCIKGVFASDLFSIQGPLPEEASGLLRRVAFSGRFIENMRLFARLDSLALQCRSGRETAEGEDFITRYPYILKAFVYSILNKRHLRALDFGALLGIIRLLDRVPVSGERLVLAALIELKICMANTISADQRAFVRMRNEYARQGLKLRLITELCNSVYAGLHGEYPDMKVFNHDIVTIAETVVALLKDKKINTYKEASALVLNKDYNLHPRLPADDAARIAEFVLYALFGDERFEYLYEVHGDEAYSEDMSEIMKVDDDVEFARVLFVNIARMLHLHYSVVYSGRLRFMLNETLRMLSPDFAGIDDPASGISRDGTIGDILVSVFLHTRGRRFGAMKRRYFLDTSA